MSMRRWIEIVERVGRLNEDTQSTQTIDNPAFEQWFGHSKVVDSHGRPLVVYHGTFRDFDEFMSGSHFGDIEAANSRIETKAARNPDRFTSNSGVIMPVYLSIQNPLRIEDDGGLVDGYDLVYAALEAKAITREETDFLLQNVRSSGVAQLRLFKLLHEKGYNGLVYRNVIEGNGDSWVPFFKHQIKSVFNRGTFSRLSDKILETTTGRRKVPLYHITDSSRLLSIQTRGLCPSFSREPAFRGRYVYLSNSAAHAEGYGDHHSDWKGAPVLLGMFSDQLDQSLLGPDDVDLPDLLGQRDWRGVSWHQSLRISGQCTYAGIIPPEIIQVSRAGSDDFRPLIVIDLSKASNAPRS